jgi:hypothetical protein
MNPTVSDHVTELGSAGAPASIWEERKSLLQLFTRWRGLAWSFFLSFCFGSFEVFGVAKR